MQSLVEGGVGRHPDPGRESRASAGRGDRAALEGAQKGEPGCAEPVRRPGRPGSPRRLPYACTAGWRRGSVSRTWSRRPTWKRPAGLPDYLRAALRSTWLRSGSRGACLLLHRQHLHAARRAVGREARPLPGDSATGPLRGLLGPGPSPSQQAIAGEAVERLQQAMDQLDEDERDLILWRHFERLSNREIAALLGISEAAAAKRVHPGPGAAAWTSD